MNFRLNNKARLARRRDSARFAQGGISLRSLSFVVAFGCFAWCGPAQAGLLGTSVASQYYAFNAPYDFVGSPASFVANGAVQETFCSSVCPEGFNLTVSDTQIVYQFFGTGGYWDSFGAALNSGGLYIDNGNLLTFTGTTISKVTLDSASTVPGFTSAGLTYNANNIATNWAGLSGISAGEEIILDVSTQTAAPEPADWSLVAAALVLVGAYRRKLRRDKSVIVTATTSSRT